MKNDPATAVHGVTTQGEHIVGIGNLRVLLIAEEGAWYAQGLEIDYIAQGESVDEAKARFEIGLLSTIRENLKIHGTIERLLTPAPPQVWREQFDPRTTANRFFHLSVHQIDEMADLRQVLPFQGIAYLRADADG